MDPRDEHVHTIVVADVDSERLARLSIQDDNSDHSGQAREEVALSPLVIVEPTNHALAREDEVRLLNRLRQVRRAHQLHEPPTLVLMHPQGVHLDAVDHFLFAPFARTKSLTW